MKILVVDDSPIVRMQLSKLLGPAGFTIVEATDGIDATEKLNTHTDLRLIICDVTMPRMNGLELLAAIRSDAHHSTIPIVMLTTECRPETIQKARALGAKGWLVKPFKADHLLAAVKKLTTEAA